jgi:hypothetical protein
MEDVFMQMTPVKHTISSNIRAPRYDVNNELVVSSKTIGTDCAYTMTVGNISRSGMLLNWNQALKIPFLENTILDLVIDPKQKILNTPVSCLAKVVRKNVVTGTDTYVQFGVRIVQIDNSDVEIWDNCLESLAQKAGKSGGFSI